MKMSEKQPRFRKEDILPLVQESLTVLEMSDRLHANFDDLCDFYAKCSSGDRTAFPLHLLLTKPWLEQQIAAKSVARIANEVYTSPAVVRRRMKLYGIKEKPRLRDILTPEVLYSLYVDQHLTDRVIAGRYNCSIDTIKKLRSQSKITHEDRITNSRIPSIEYYHRLHVTMGFTFKQLSLLTGQSVSTIKRLDRAYSDQGHPLSAEIAAQNKLFAYRDLIDLLLKKIVHHVLYEQLKEHTIAETAEMYDLIPPAIPDVETFSSQWLEIQFRSKSLLEILNTYHIGKNYVKEMMDEAGLKPLPVTERIDPEVVRLLYIQNCWTDAEIAHVFGVSVYTISKLRENNHIRHADKLTAEQRLTADEFHRLFVNEGLTTIQIALLYQVSEKRINLLKKKYSVVYPIIAEYFSPGVSEGRMQFLMKQLKYKGFTGS